MLLSALFSVALAVYARRPRTSRLDLLSELQPFK
jgi:hypothetical protein